MGGEHPTACQLPTASLCHHEPPGDQDNNLSFPTALPWPSSGHNGLSVVTCSLPEYSHPLNVLSTSPRVRISRTLDLKQRVATLTGAVPGAKPGSLHHLAFLNISSAPE